MTSELNHIDALISRVLCGAASSAEKVELNIWIGESPRNQKIFDESKRIWENSRKPFSASEIRVDREKMKDKLIEQLSQTSKVRNLRLWFVRAAAILALPVMLGLGWYLGNSDNTGETQQCEVTAPKGQISKCVLADGTQIWLNAGSTITYDPVLRGETREVKLNGEAYFKVSKNEHKPFIVTTEHARIKVLGTVFNLKAYSGEDKVETTLEEGNVEFSLIGSKTAPVELKPGEQVVYDIAKKQIEVGSVDTYLHTAWKDGKYVFKDADLQTIIQELEKLYDVRIHVKDDKLLGIRFRGMFEYEENIFSAMETLEAITNLKYRMDGRDIWLQ
ncbi:MAG: FecR domain-containing protein [Prolixibacteraceae bacterium]|jgi:ferric-dicitrate binding protein FerR (iron transport regulator)